MKGRTRGNSWLTLITLWISSHANYLQCALHTPLLGVYVWVPECMWESGCVCVYVEYSPWQTTPAYLIIMAIALSLSINAISVCWRHSPIALTVNNGRRLRRLYKVCARQRRGLLFSLLFALIYFFWPACVPNYKPAMSFTHNFSLTDPKDYAWSLDFDLIIAGC